MSQHDYVISDQGMPAARADINNALQALASTNKGPSAPATAYAGELWVDDSASPWVLKLYDGTDWISIGTINPTTNLFQATKHVRTDVKPVFETAIDEAPWINLASATTVDIGAAAANSVLITGTTTIANFGTAASGVTRRLRFAGVLTLTYNGTSMILPGGANILTAANDTATFVSLGAGNWICVDYKKQSGQAVVAPSGLTLTAGTPLVLNPVSTGAPAASQAHGLGAVPQLVACALECLTADQGYSPGEILDLSMSISDSNNNRGLTLLKSSSVLALYVSASDFLVAQKSGGTGAITGSRWKLTITPYKVA